MDDLVNLFSKSDLIAHDDYLSKIPENSKITMWVSNINPDAKRILLPVSPSDKRIFEAAQKLKSAGHNVAIKSYGDDFIEAKAKEKKISKEQLNQMLDPKWSQYGE